MQLVRELRQVDLDVVLRGLAPARSWIRNRPKSETMIVSGRWGLGRESAYRLTCSKGVTMTPWRSSGLSRSAPRDFCSIIVLASGMITSMNPRSDVDCSKRTAVVTFFIPTTSCRSSSQNECVSPFSYPLPAQESANSLAARTRARSSCAICSPSLSLFER